MALTQTQMDQAEFLLNEEDVTAFYEYLEAQGDRYARLALGVTKNDTWQGQVANGFLHYAAKNKKPDSKLGEQGDDETEKPDFKFGSSEWETLNKNLAQEHLSAYKNNYGEQPSWSTIQNYHNNVYKDVDLNENDWFPNIILNDSSDPDELWEDWQSNDGFFDILQDALVVVGVGGGFPFISYMISGKISELEGLTLVQQSFAKNARIGLSHMDEDGIKSLAADLNVAWGFNQDDLIVWRDLNSDGISGQDEMFRLMDLNITSISLGYTDVNYDIAGNTIRSESTFTMNDNTTRTIVDTWFTYDNVNTVYAGDYDLDVRTLFMPTIRGYGQLPDLHIAMSLDETLLQMVGEIVVKDMKGLLDPAFDLHGRFKDIMLQWGNIGWKTTRGLMDGQKLAFLETLLDTPYRQANGNFNHGMQATANLEAIFDDALNAMMARLLIQTVGQDIFDQAGEYHLWSDEFIGDFTLDFDAIENLMNDLSLTGDGLLRAWANIARLIEGTIGFVNLSIQDQATLSGLIEASDPTGILDMTEILRPVARKPGMTTRYGTSDDDTIVGNVFEDRIYGQDGDDIIDGGAGDDVLHGYNGDDVLNGGNGHDILYGGNGNDTLTGGAGDDTLVGGSGVGTYVFGWGWGVDTIIDNGINIVRFTDGITADDIHITTSDTGNFYIYDRINPGNVVIVEGTFYQSNDVSVPGISSIVFDDISTHIILEGSDANNDTIYAVNYRMNTIHGYGGDDILHGHGWSDILYGGDGDDVLHSYNGDDVLDGGNGNDTLHGGNGNDTLHGGDGLDVMTGGSGADTYTFKADSAFNNRDVITDFNRYENDKINLSDLIETYDPLSMAITDFISSTTVGQDTIISVDASGSGTNFVEIALLENRTGLTDIEDLIATGHLIIF